MNSPREIPASIGGADRHLFRNASESPMVMKASPFGGWEDLKKTKLNLDGAFKGNWATAHGEKYEAQAREAFANKHAIQLLGPERFINGQYAASVDDHFTDTAIHALGEMERTEHWILEIKCPAQGKKSKIWKSVMDYGDPSYYYWQMIHQLYCVPDAKGVVLFVYDAETGHSCECEITRDEKSISQLLAAWDEFYEWMVSGEPDPNNGVVIRTDVTWKEVANRFVLLKKQSDEINEKLESVRKELIELAETGKETGAGVTVSKTERKGNINYKAIPALKDIDLEQYRSKSTEVITITIDKE